MYSLETPLSAITGIGPKLLEKFAQKNITTLKELLLFLPLRYSDRSEIIQIKDLEPNKLVSFMAHISTVKTFYKNRRKIDSATASDSTGKVKLLWFNNKFIASSIQPDQLYMISGKPSEKGGLIQPTVEKINPETDTIHTGRLVPIYSSTLDVAQGTLRRILKQALAKYELTAKTQVVQTPEFDLAPLEHSFKQLHFPDSPEAIIQARERLALEELLGLIKTSHEIKAHWKTLHTATAILARPGAELSSALIPNSIPFELTGAQLRCATEILHDIAETTPMNRLLIGDVGSGKTVVAGIAAFHTLAAHKSVALIAPTKILASQHYQTLQSLFPNLPITLVTSATKKIATTKGAAKTTGATTAAAAATKDTTTPQLFVGTHKLINKLADIQPALIIYDEQHRFGVTQRSQATALEKSAHTITMSATPIPRSLMLTIFSHLSVSTIDELPKGRIPTKTWIVPEEKRQSAYEWIAQELKTQPAAEAENEAATQKKLVLIVCPFIDPSNHEAFENIASAKQTFESVQTAFHQLSEQPLNIALLHGRMKPEEQNKIITKLYAHEIDILVTTPVIEVGVDLPTASIIVIEAAQRFGMASLHQLRGRVGRAGQQGYCLLLSDTKSPPVAQRLNNFSRENNGLKLAELDLQSRGSGDIFGTAQSGFSSLQFASWTNLELIGKAQKIYKTLPQGWKPLLEITITDENSESRSQAKPLAN